MFSALLSFIGLGGVSLGSLGTRLGLAVALAAGCVAYGYHWGHTAAQNACEARMVKPLADAIAKRDEAALKAAADHKRQQEAAARTITELERSNESSKARIRALASRPVATCGGHVVIDDDWLRHFNAVLARGSATTTDDSKAVPSHVPAEVPGGVPGGKQRQ